MISSVTEITSAQARSLAINSQKLYGNIKADKMSILELIKALGYVQIDTINIINRAHHHTLFTRTNGYSPAYLDELLSRDKSVFEFFGHALSYLPMEDYRFYSRRIREFPTKAWEKQWLKEAEPYIDKVLQRIKDDGPLGIKDFSKVRGDKQTIWTYSPIKVALETLVWRGDLMIDRRDNFQRIYNLTERIIPEDINASNPDDLEMGIFFVRKTLSAHGILTAKEMEKFVNINAKKIIKAGIAHLINSGEVIKVRLEGDTTEYFMLEYKMENIDKPIENEIRILSPFDNLIIIRERIEKLFNFSYRLECYVPEKKRIFGYFVLPVIWRDKFALRIDVKAERKKKELVIKRLHKELPEADSKEFKNIFEYELQRFMKFQNCEKIVWECENL